VDQRFGSLVNDNHNKFRSKQVDESVVEQEEEKD
jgi:hypothetical protein